MPKVIVHRASGSQLTIDTRSGEGLRVFLHRATFARDSSGSFLRPGSHKPETRAKKTPITDAMVQGKEVKVGDWVGFKSDIEQYGKIVAINGDKLTLENTGGFSGGYIGGKTRTVERASNCWRD